MTRIAVGMSGGVDSAVAASLLIDQGHDVEGLFMKNWEEESKYCSAEQDYKAALQVCDVLGIPLRSVNFAKEYWDRVFEHFLIEYRAGRTPNPDILCNKEVKFKAFLDYAETLGAAFIATGYYVRKANQGDETWLLKGLDSNKDQSYFLHAVGQSKLARTLFPVGELEKPAVRELAEKHGLITHDKKDSTGICFIGERKFADFLKQYIPAQPGNIETEQGEVIGQHQGLMYHTIGQRQGLGIGGLKNHDESAWYVAQKDLGRNVLIAVQGKNHPLLFSQTLTTSQVDWINHAPSGLPMRCKAKVRYRQDDQDCILTALDNGHYLVTFDTPQRAVTPGQSVAFYREDQCLGGGIIETTGETTENS